MAGDGQDHGAKDQIGTRVPTSRGGVEEEDEDSDGEGSGSDEAGEEDEAEEVELDLDDSGRISGTSDCGLYFDFDAVTCIISCVQGDQVKKGLGCKGLIGMLQKDCEAVFGKEDSFWLPYGAEPRCTMERLAADVFAHHTRDVKQFDLSGSGAEWWVQVRLPEGQTGQGSGYIGFHWDKDEDLVDAAGISLHPQVSTVTYLCSDGAPTLICERRAPLDYGDLDELYSDDRAFSRAYLSYPFCVCAPGSEDAVVKHVSFDGQLLHSAPREFARDGASKGIRYTFLVNIWLGHTPLALEPLPDELLPSLSNERLSLQLSGRKPCPREAAQASGSRRFAATFGPSGTEHEVSFGWPPLGGSEDRNGDSCCTLEIDLGRAGAMGHIRAAPPPVLAQAPTIDAGEATWDSFLSLYRLHQVVLVKGGGRKQGLGGSIGLSHLRQLYRLHQKAVEATWNLESICSASGAGITAASVLGSSGREEVAGGAPPAKAPKKSEDVAWYASFVLNRSLWPSAWEEALGLLPVAEPHFFLKDPREARHTANVWFFFGRNPLTEGDGKGVLQGRPEHTDKVANSGTWHAQQSGSKLWFIRPDPAARWPEGSRCPECRPQALTVKADAGDLLVINTDLWYHRTEIPCTAGAADELSFSYARDFFLGPVTGEEDPDVEMDNCDDTWATEFVPAGTVIAQGPEAAIFPSSDDPNCRLEGNGDVVVAFRDIQPGESLSVPPK